MTSRKYRIDHGLCPACGKEAAPYYLCERCRHQDSLRKMLHKMADHGIIDRHKEGRDLYWCPPSKPPPVTPDLLRFWNANTIWDMDPDDPRRRPRLGRRPVDLMDTLIGIFREANRPLQEAEVIAAWAKLRSKRKTQSLAGDMTALINAQRRRDERNAKRARLVHH